MQQTRELNTLRVDLGAARQSNEALERRLAQQEAHFNQTCRDQDEQWRLQLEDFSHSAALLRAENASLQSQLTDCKVKS